MTKNIQLFALEAHDQDPFDSKGALLATDEIHDWTLRSSTTHVNHPVIRNGFRSRFARKIIQAIRTIDRLRAAIQIVEVSLSIHVSAEERAVPKNPPDDHRMQNEAHHNDSVHETSSHITHEDLRGHFRQTVSTDKPSDFMMRLIC